MDSDSDADSNPVIFVSKFQNINNNFVTYVLLFEGTFTSFFKDKNGRNHVFLTIFA